MHHLHLGVRPLPSAQIRARQGQHFGGLGHDFATLAAAYSSGKLVGLTLSSILPRCRGLDCRTPAHNLATAGRSMASRKGQLPVRHTCAVEVPDLGNVTLGLLGQLVEIRIHVCLLCAYSPQTIVRERLRARVHRDGAVGS